MTEAFDNRLSLTAKDCETITGLKASTFLYYTWRDAQTTDDEPKLGPPSFKIGRRRLWLRTDVLDWLAQAQRRD